MIYPSGLLNNLWVAKVIKGGGNVMKNKGGQRKSLASGNYRN